MEKYTVYSYPETNFVDYTILPTISFEIRKLINLYEDKKITEQEFQLEYKRLRNLPDYPLVHPQYKVKK